MNGVRLLSVHATVPPRRFAQEECLDFVLAHLPVKESTRALYRRVFRNPSVRTRHFALERLEDVLETDLDRVNARFERWAPRLAAEALDGALKKAGRRAADLDFLAATTCTGYLCPGITSHLVEKLGLRQDLRGADIVGMGCGAAIPALEQARNFLSAHPGATAAVVSAEICSAAMYSDDAADLVVSNALFGDGAAAAVLRASGGEDGPGRGPSAPEIHSFAALTVPLWRDDLRFKTQNGRLRNVLGKDVPAQAAEALEELLSRILPDRGLERKDVDRWIFHAGGEKVLDAIQERLRLPPEALRSSRNVLRDYGNMSSPTVLFALDEEMRRRPPAGGQWGVMASFGAGFSAHAALIRF